MQSLQPLSMCKLTRVKDKCEANNIFWYFWRHSVPTPTLTQEPDSMEIIFHSFPDIIMRKPVCCECRWPYFLVVLHIQVVLVSVLVTVGQGNDGDSVDRLHQSSLRKCLCHHLAAKVWHRIPDGRREKGRGVGEHIKGTYLQISCRRGLEIILWLNWITLLQCIMTSQKQGSTSIINTKKNT